MQESFRYSYQLALSSERPGRAGDLYEIAEGKWVKMKPLTGSLYLKATREFKLDASGNAEEMLKELMMALMSFFEPVEFSWEELSEGDLYVPVANRAVSDFFGQLGLSVSSSNRS